MQISVLSRLVKRMLELERRVPWLRQKRPHRSDEDPPAGALVGARLPRPTPPPLQGSVALKEPISGKE